MYRGGLQRLSSSKFQAIGLNIEHQWCGKNNWWQLADCRCCQQAMSEIDMQYSTGYRL